MVVWNKKHILGLVLPVLMSPLFCSGDNSVTHSGIYSLDQNDPTNAWDAPVPGFVGPAGDGVTVVYDNDYTEDIDEFNGNYLNPVFTGWARLYDDEGYIYEGVNYWPILAGLDGLWDDYNQATGPLKDKINNVVSLGDWGSDSDIGVVDPGYMTLYYPEPIGNVPGADLVVYENGFTAGSDEGGVGIGGIFAELAYVEVSTDGENFARFPSQYMGDVDPGQYGSLDPTLIYNLAGKHSNNYGINWGTPFDFTTLLQQPNVLNGTVDLMNIHYVRIVDIPGTGYYTDSDGRPIYDPHYTTGSGGFDLDAIGAVGQSIDFEKWDAGRGLVKMGDNDGDGVVNLLEYAFDMNPLVNDAELLPSMVVVDGHPQLQFRRDVRLSDIIYVVEATESLTAPDWQPVAVVEAFSDPVVPGGDLELATASTVSRHKEASLGVWQNVKFTDLALDSNRFYRVRVETVTE